MYVFNIRMITIIVVFYHIPTSILLNNKVLFPTNYILTKDAFIVYY